MLFQLQSKNSQTPMCLRERNRECCLHQQPTEDPLVCLAEGREGSLQQGRTRHRGHAELKGIYRWSRQRHAAFGLTFRLLVAQQQCARLVLERQTASTPRLEYPFPLCSHLSSPSPFSVPFSSFSLAFCLCFLASNSLFLLYPPPLFLFLSNTTLGRSSFLCAIRDEKKKCAMLATPLEVSDIKIFACRDKQKSRDESKLGLTLQNAPSAFTC